MDVETNQMWGILMRTLINSVKLKIAVIILISASTLLIYTNMGRKYVPPTKIQLAVVDSINVQISMNNYKGKNEKLYNLFRKHKLMIDNIIAARSFSKNCNDFLAVNSTLETGIYMLFISGNPNEPVPVKCTVTKGVIVSQEIIAQK